MSDELLPAGRRIRVSFDAVLPAAATPDQVLDWMKYATAFTGSMSDNNPLADHEMEAVTEPELTDTGRHSNVYERRARMIQDVRDRRDIRPTGG